MTEEPDQEDHMIFANHKEQSTMRTISERIEAYKRSLLNARLDRELDALPRRVSVQLSGRADFKPAHDRST